MSIDVFGGIKTIASSFSAFVIFRGLNTLNRLRGVPVGRLFWRRCMTGVDIMMGF